MRELTIYIKRKQSYYFACFTHLIVFLLIERVQNEPHQNVPFWHVGYFELKKIRALKIQEELFTSPFTA